MQNLLIVGGGDIARRALPLLIRRFRVIVLLRDAAAAAGWRAAGALPLIADLDDRPSLRRVAGLAQAVLHLAPPPESGEYDRRTRNLLATLARGSLPRRLVYVGTTGVYGDCAGALVSETRPVRPATARARRRLDAEHRLRAFGARHAVRVSLLRAPGIYAADRLPIERLRLGLPVLSDVLTSHIHADDLAALCRAALDRGRANRVYHAADDSRLSAAEYFDLLADHLALPHPPRCTHEEAARVLSPMQMSFWSESRQIANPRLKELGFSLAHPRVAGIREKEAVAPP